MRLGRREWYCAAICACSLLIDIPGQCQIGSLTGPINIQPKPPPPFETHHPDWTNMLHAVYGAKDAVDLMLSGVSDMLPKTWEITLKPYDQTQSDWVTVVIVNHYIPGIDSYGAAPALPAILVGTNILLANKAYCNGRASLTPAALNPDFGGNVGHFVANAPATKAVLAALGGVDPAGGQDPLTPFPPCVQLSTVAGVSDSFKTGGQAVQIVQTDVLTTLQNQVNQLQQQIIKLQPKPSATQSK
jgi:hypothetical protein